MAASGAPDVSKDHALNIADVSIQLLKQVRSLKLPSGIDIQIRIGTSLCKNWIKVNGNPFPSLLICFPKIHANPRFIAHLFYMQEYTPGLPLLEWLALKFRDIASLAILLTQRQGCRLQVR